MRMFLTIFLIFITSSSVYAADCGVRFAKNIDYSLTDELVNNVADQARVRFIEAVKRGAYNDPSYANTPVLVENIKNPVIPAADSMDVFDQAIVSAYATVCGIDFVPTFGTFMNKQRAKGTWAVEQISFISFMHGFVSVSYAKQEIHDGCNDERKKLVKDYIRECQKIPDDLKYTTH